MKSFPRPANDTSIGIHLAQTALFGDELALWLDRVKAMNMSWVTTLQTDSGFMQAAAARNLGVVCRPFTRANHEYGAADGDCVEHMIAAGVTPYVQIYNEPDLLGTEWEGEVPDDYDWAMRTWASRWIVAARWISGRGGYPGIQTLDQNWYRHLLTRLRDEDPALLKKAWFSCHNYMSNHDIGYTEDAFAWLGPLWFDAVANEVLGHSLMTICTEGGWAIGDAADNRYPAITPELHRDNTVASFAVFKTGLLPNGQPLPDWWFGVTPWLLASVAVGGDSAFENNAWYSSWFGERTLTIEAVKSLPPFVRRFTWDDAPDPIDPDEEEPTMPGFSYGFETLHDLYPETIGEATDKQIDLFGGPNRKISFQTTEKGLLVWTPGSGPQFVEWTTLPKV